VKALESATLWIAQNAPNDPEQEAKLISARFYFEKILPEIGQLKQDIETGKASMMDLDDDHWAA